MKNTINIVLLLSVVIMLALSGCKKSGTGSTEPQNNNPMISSLTVSPGTVAANGLALIRVYATDEDEDEMTYSFAPDDGEISGTGTTVYWIAPDTEGTYSITATVSDGQGGEVTATGNLTVTQAVTQITGIVKLKDGLTGNLIGSRAVLFEFGIQQWVTNVFLADTTVTSSSRVGVFNLTGIAPGSYLLETWKDVNDSGMQNAGDYYGVYGHINFFYDPWEPFNPVHFNPTNIQIADGETVMVDIVMEIIP